MVAGVGRGARLGEDGEGAGDWRGGGCAGVSVVFVVEQFVQLSVEDVVVGDKGMCFLTGLCEEGRTRQN